MFCEHGNIIGSCRECTPERYKAKVSAQILEDVDCPVWELLRRKEDDESIPAERCNNSGVKIGTRFEFISKSNRSRRNRIRA